MMSRTTVAVLMIGPAFWLSALVSGCAATPPKDAVASAQTLVQRAEQEGAAQFAPRPLREAKDKIEKAQGEAKNDGDARRLAEQAQVDAMLAAVEADRQKTKEAVTELSRTVQAMENDIHSEHGTPPLSTPLPTEPPRSEVR